MTEFNPSPKDFLFVPLGGCNEIGMNLNLYGYDGKWLMVDLGVTFGEALGVEVFTPDPEFIIDRKDDLAGLLLTHAHEDHIGAVPYLWKYLQCPIYATPFTVDLVRRKLDDVGLLKKAKIIEIPLSGTVDIGPFNINLITLTHSIPEPNGVAIKTPLGTVLHTGDWKLDPDPIIGSQPDEKALRKLGKEGVLAMVCDSTNVFEPDNSGSEGEVQEGLIDVMGRYKDSMIVVASFASNVARLESIATAAQKLGRKVTLVGRSLDRMNYAARSLGYLKNVAPFISHQEAQSVPRDKLVLISTGSQGESRAALNRIAHQQHRSFHIEHGDVVIFSSRIIPGNEKRISALMNTLVRLGAEIVVQNKLLGKTKIHVSGHPARDELREMYEWIKPKVAIPVHGEPRHLREHARFAEECGIKNAIVPCNGSVVKLAPGETKIIDQVTAGQLALDGSVLVSSNSLVLRERKRMSVHGTAVVTLVFDRQEELAEDPQITLHGVISETETEERAKRLYTDIVREISRSLDELPPHKRERDSAIEEATRVALRRAVNQRLGKKPLTEVHVVRIN
ncbi:MAG: ribonuclease J [Alphaproteobacteria bacterium]|jgi:ribonuclease J|nr:ribonuclease J [Alphaproteobacteria bacterium]MBT5389429.1 ribonuclease J [Alphaproteobacteria bacterium]